MGEFYSTAFMLLLVGMITVFVILAAVVLLGKLIISFANRYFPEEVKQVAESKKITHTIHASKLTALVAAVDIITKGKGRITGIKKQDY